MARVNRCDAIDESTVGVYHCVNRCVRRAFLCGEDPVSGRNYDHRKSWVQQRLEFLAGEFAIDVVGFSVMSNHFHTILRNRPDVVTRWSDSEVASRWWKLFPSRRNDDDTPATPRPAELKSLAAKIDKLRKRLSSISWLMRCLAENVARRANKEDDCTGHFWEGRFKSMELLDASSVLACAIYVDLNPIRAAVTTTPEESRFTSAYERIHARRKSAQRRACGGSTRDGWLSPVELQTQEPSLTSTSRQRASDRGFLPLKLNQYLQLLDWTGRQVCTNKQGAIPAQLKPILERLQLSSDCWVDLIDGFGRWFHRVAGRPPSMETECQRRGRSWLHGISRARQAFA